MQFQKDRSKCARARALFVKKIRLFSRFHMLYTVKWTWNCIRTRLNKKSLKSLLWTLFFFRTRIVFTLPDILASTQTSFNLFLFLSILKTKDTWRISKHWNWTANKHMINPSMGIAVKSRWAVGRFPWGKHSHLFLEGLVHLDFYIMEIWSYLK